MSYYLLAATFLFGAAIGIIVGAFVVVWEQSREEDHVITRRCPECDTPYPMEYNLSVLDAKKFACNYCNTIWFYYPEPEEGQDD
jgi:hypothetical protein